MFVLMRAITYAILFIGLVLIFLPAQLIPGLTRPEAIGALEIVGIAVTAGGAAIAVWCVLTFAVIGKGTPAPFDPPRRLVIRGPYAFVRNPMYIGAGLALAGASLFYQSIGLLGYAAAFFVITHVFVLVYEEPVLRRTFGADYESYCHRVGRWWPRLRRGVHREG